MTNKTQNMFRDGNKRLSPKEAMVRRHRRKHKINESVSKADKLKYGLYSLMQVLFIYST